MTRGRELFYKDLLTMDGKKVWVEYQAHIWHISVQSGIETVRVKGDCVETIDAKGGCLGVYDASEHYLGTKIYELIEEGEMKMNGRKGRKLTIAELENMDGKKVWVDGVGFCAAGVHTVNVEERALIDKSGGVWMLESGCHADGNTYEWIESYVVGDKVKVRTGLAINSYYNGECLFNSSMKAYEGKVLEITSAYKNSDGNTRYTVAENGWRWTDDMLEPVNEEITAAQAPAREWIKVKCLESGGYTYKSKEGEIYDVFKAIGFDGDEYYYASEQQFENQCGWSMSSFEVVKPIEYKIGDKVVPHAKTAKGYEDNFEGERNWRVAKEKGQPYLYVANFTRDEAGEKCLKLSYDPERRAGNYYRMSDVTPYVEPIKEEATLVSEKAKELLVFLAAHRAFVGKIGLTSYSETKYQVGAVLKDKHPSDLALEGTSYFVIAPVVSAKEDQTKTGFYHGMKVFFNKETSAWDASNRGLVHIGNGDRCYEYVTNEGAKFLEELFATNPKVEAEKKALKAEIETMEAALSEKKKKLQGAA